MVVNFLLERCFDIYLELCIIFSDIFRKSSRKNDDTKVESSFVIDAVAVVSLRYVMYLVYGFFFLCSITWNDAWFSMSYEARMWCLYTFMVVVGIGWWKVKILFVGM